MKTMASKHSRIDAPKTVRNTLVPSLRVRAAGFTLTEMLVAIAVLLIVIIATSKIFGTASKITGIGQGNQDVISEAAAIERQLRDDIARLSKEGFFAIHCVAVRNDVRGLGSPLLNPNLAPGAIIRADQLVFFTNSVEATKAYQFGAGGINKGQGTISRVYVGPGYQLPRGRAFDIAAARSHDLGVQPTGTMTPWWPGPGNPPTANMESTLYVGGGGTATTCFSRAAAGTIDATQPEARKWLLCRQAVTLLDDDTGNNNENAKTVYLGQAITARSIWDDRTPPVFWGFSRELLNGRVDGAATLLSEVRKHVTVVGANARPWNNPAAPAATGGDQRRVIQAAVYYPRAERVAPSTHRVDQALTNSVISSACSSFTIDWTYEGSDVQRIDANGNIVGGVGEVVDTLGNVIDPTPATPNSGDELSGIKIFSDGEQPWFGLKPDFDNNGVSDDGRGVRPYGGALTPQDNWIHAATIQPATYPNPVAAFPNNIESQSVNTPVIDDYWAVFGYNQTEALDPITNNFWSATSPSAYTPWPTAIRVTMVLHDPAGRLEAGREVQFVIDLPKR